MSGDKVTPLMQQYFSIKSQYPETLLLFQVGDFYELFFEDAATASSFLAIALTKRGKNKGEDIPLCGIPVHALNHYLTKLVRGGFKVAICDQLSEPRPGTIVERGVTQVFTPGTLTELSMLDEKSASYLLTFYPGESEWGLMFAEVLSAQLFATRLPAGNFRMLDSELSRFFPDEVVMPQMQNLSSFNSYFKKNGYVLTVSQGEDIALEGTSKAWIESQFHSSHAQRLYDSSSLCGSAKLLFEYLSKTQKRSLEQFRKINFYQPDDYLLLDSSTQKNLEIVKNSSDSSRNNTLLSVVDCAKTAMGSRCLKKWLTRPLLQKKAIEQRQELVGILKEDVNLLQKLEELLSYLPDLERIVGRIGLRRATLQDYLALKGALGQLPSIKEALQSCRHSDLLASILEKFADFSPLHSLLHSALNEQIESKWIIKKGFDSELDRLRELVENSQQSILQLERREVERTGISSLKVGYNKVGGYYIEVTKVNSSLVPDDYIRVQTLAARERYTTKELIDLERQINSAYNKINTAEYEVFDRVKHYVEEWLFALRATAYGLSYIDAIYSFASIAYENGYVAPTFNESREIIIEQGRHCVVEQGLSSGFIPNDTALCDQESIWVITGPNMGGKSTYLRQVALICILAQSGSFVPAKRASLPLLDRIFTRIGSGDNLAQGKSTFLVEMEETAAICSQATKNSLVILDEVGRGTSTFDGIAIAQATLEYIHSKIGARTLFATHYYELTSLQSTIEGVVNYHMSSKKTQDGIIFLHKIEKGVAQGSFGLEVATLAGLPNELVARAKDILHMLQASGHELLQSSEELKSEKILLLQQELEKKDQALQRIKQLELDEVSPRQALELLWELKREQ